MAHIIMAKKNNWKYRWVIFENGVNKADLRSWGGGQSFSSYLFLNPVRGLDSSSSVLSGNVNTHSGIKRSGDAGDVSSGMCLLDGQQRFREKIGITSAGVNIKAYTDIDMRTRIRLNSSSGSIINNYNICDGNENQLYTNVQYDQLITLKGLFNWRVAAHPDRWDYYHLFIARFNGAQYQKYWMQEIITIRDLVLYL